MQQEARTFAIHHCLGSGGFGEVYLANMLSSGGVQSEVALKVLHRGLDPRSQAVQRLRDEARLLGTLNHPCVLKVHDLVMLDDRVALVAEYVDGADMEWCLGRLEMPLRSAVSCLARVADALDAAWSTEGPDGKRLELVHRDIKPANIQVGRHGQVKLLDFGIAKASDVRREAKTELTMRYIGTPWYMAPERFAKLDDDPSSDVYSLGCCLFEAHSKRRLFEIDPSVHFHLAIDRERHDAHVSEALAALDWPEEVTDLALRMLAFKREDRPSAAQAEAAMDELAEDLDGLSLRRWCRRTEWPRVEENGKHGELEGRTLSEATLHTSLSKGTPVPTFRGRSGNQPPATPAVASSLAPKPPVQAPRAPIPPKPPQSAHAPKAPVKPTAPKAPVKPKAPTPTSAQGTPGADGPPISTGNTPIPGASRSLPGRAPSPVLRAPKAPPSKLPQPTILPPDPEPSLPPPAQVGPSVPPPPPNVRSAKVTPPPAKARTADPALARTVEPAVQRAAETALPRSVAWSATSVWIGVSLLLWVMGVGLIAAIAALLALA